MKESVRRSRSTSVRLGELCEANRDAARMLVWFLWCASSLFRVPDGARQENHLIIIGFGCVINFYADAAEYERNIKYELFIILLVMILNWKRRCEVCDVGL